MKERYYASLQKNVTKIGVKLIVTKIRFPFRTFEIHMHVYAIIYNTFN